MNKRELVRIKKDNATDTGWKVIYIKNRSFYLKRFGSLLDAMDFSKHKLLATSEDVYLAISLNK